MDLLAIGHAIIDVTSCVDGRLFAEIGSSHERSLVNPAEADRIADRMENVRREVGGSAANTAIAAASLGESVGFIGCVADDELGAWYRGEMTRHSVRFSGRSVAQPSRSGRCLTLVTPSGEQKFVTALGAAADLDASDLHASEIAAAQTLFVEGYILSATKGRFVLDQLLQMKPRSTIAFTVGHADVAHAHRDWLIDRLDRVGVVFANREEALALSGRSSPEEAADCLHEFGPVSIVTCGEYGAFVKDDGGLHHIAPHRADAVVDTIGAGDAFAAAVLVGVHRGMSFAGAAEIASSVAARTLGHAGPRLRLHEGTSL